MSADVLECTTRRETEDAPFPDPTTENGRKADAGADAGPATGSRVRAAFAWAGAWKGQAVGSLLAAALLVAAVWLPFWKVDLQAPQYPSGLQMVAYGDRIDGDLREINIINHYVGMRHIDAVPAPEMAMFPWAMAALVVLAFAAPLHRRLAQLAILAAAAMPVAILADLQWWLHEFGRSLDPKAPIRVDPFTPLAIGVSSIGNFRSTAMVSWGFFAMLAAALLLWLGYRARHRGGLPEARPLRAAIGHSTAQAIGAVLLLAAVVVASPAAGIAGRQGEIGLPGFVRSAGVPAAGTSSGATLSLQSLVDAAPAGSTLRVPPGTYRGPLRLAGPLTLVGVDGAVIEGDGEGSVVELSGDGVVFRGFTVRNSGRAVTEEAAGIKVRGNRHRIEDNRVVDVYFGIHLSDGSDNLVARNRIAPGEKHGARPGHAVSLWHQRRSRVVGNVISDSRDGIYLSFADDLHAEGNQVTGTRYGIHSMYSESSTFVGNRLRDNLLGAALMYSNGLEMRCNRIEHNRRGATAYGVLLKDIDGLVLEDNLILANRVGIYADSTPLGVGREALVRRNRILGNDAALALQSNVALTFYDNEVSGNLTVVRSEGKGLSAGNRWSREGRGNYWDAYAGFDADADGIGDVPFRYEAAMNELLARAPLARAFVYTPASMALERAARLFPLVRVEPLIVDPAPLIRPPSPGARAVEAAACAGARP